MSDNPECLKLALLIALLDSPMPSQLTLFASLFVLFLILMLDLTWLLVSLIHFTKLKYLLFVIALRHLENHV